MSNHKADRKTLPGKRGLTGTAFQGGNLIATASPELDARYDPDVDTPEDGLPGPLLCVPIRLRGKVVGLCRVFLPGDGDASSRTGEALAAGLSAAVRNVLYDGIWFQTIMPWASLVGIRVRG